MRLILKKDSRQTEVGARAAPPPTQSAAESVGKNKSHASTRPEGNDGKRSPVFSFPKSFAAMVSSSTKTSWRSSDGGSDVTTGTCQSSIDENELPPPARDCRDVAADGSSSRRAIHLSISSESDSVQVDIVSGSGALSDEDEQDEDDEVRLYTVGNFDYFVRDRDDGSQHGDGRFISNAAGESRKSSRRGSSFFKRSPKKDDDKPSSGEDGNEETKKDESNEKSEDKGSGDGDDGEGGDKRDFNPTREVNFDDLRVQFAEQCTLALHAGAEDAAPTEMPTWTPVDGTGFMVRKGPNYASKKEKGRSLPSLYEVYAVRYYRSDKRTINGATRIMPLPPLPIDLHENADTDEDHEDDGKPEKHHPELEGTKVPDVLVVHFMLPYEPPNMFKAKTDGKGGECVYYLRPTRRFLDEMSGRLPPTPATTLFAKWCSSCESDLQMRSRFKCMALVRDIEKHNFGLLKSYNGKPVLITESGRACSGYHGDVRYLEMTANVHNWAFMAKKGFVSIIPKFAQMQMEVGFTIEAHTDAEMPECMLGSTVLSYINDTSGPIIDPKVQVPVHEHQA